MKNECRICGGGFGGYIAPEARCTCTEAKKKVREDLRHTMVLAEYKYLMACGWKPTEKFISAKAGFNWNASNGEGPFTQDQALEIQKAWDMNPTAQKWHELGCKYNKIEDKMKTKLANSEDVTQERRQLAAISDEMQELSKKRVPRDATSPSPQA